MHKIILLLAFMPLLAFSQVQVKETIVESDSTTAKYCRVKLDGETSVTSIISNKVKLIASVDYGSKEGFEPLLDEKGKKIYFVSYIQMLNFFYKKGWELVFLRDQVNWTATEFLLQRKRGN